KELIENSIDANCSTITIDIQTTLSSLIITDDGDGIDREDFDKLCIRHYTSKFTGDMLTINTFGFRGEALSSISLSSKITVESKKKGADLGNKARFEGNKLKEIKSVGMCDGTSIRIDDIFYNNEIRRKYFYKKTEEFTKIFYLIANYSIYYNNVKFILYIDKKLRNDFITDMKSKDDAIVKKLKLINSVYKNSTSLLKIVTENWLILHSSVNLGLNHYFFILFINGRLVQNKYLREGIRQIYTQFLMKHKYPFIYIEIYVSLDNIDINIHPEKKEVIFFNEEDIYDKIIESIKENLQQKNLVQFTPKKIVNSSLILNTPNKIIYPEDKNSNVIEILSSTSKETTKRDIFIDYKLEIIDKFKNNIVQTENFIAKNIIFVGIFNKDIILQHGPSLMMTNNFKLSQEFFLQSLIFGFGNFESVSVSIPYQNKISDNHSKILKHYFLFNFNENLITQLPMIVKTSIEKYVLDFIDDFSKIKLDDEENVFNFIFNNLSCMFAKACELNANIFDKMKQKLIITNKQKKEFKIITTLNELYKLFER
ncbi:DNA mismatch repair protein, partial [Conglomerata obtusa]